MVEIRPLIPSDARLVEEVFRGLGPESRRARFHGAKPRLTASDREQLLAVDGDRHVAFVALADGRPVGVSRLVRDSGTADSAEVAFAVVDAWQGRGVGKQLAARLYSEAARLGIRTIRGLVLLGNERGAALVKRAGRVVDRSYEGAAVELTVEL
jgi:GNAT superfamily N-acetyltransferase